MIAQISPLTTWILVLQLALILLGILGGGVFTGVLIKIRYQILGRLIGLFNPYFWIGLWLLHKIFDKL